MLNKVLVIIALIFIGIAIAFDVNYFNYSLPIEHKAFKTISLRDFKGLRRINQDLYGDSEFAFIETEIKIVSDKYPFVKAYFHPSRSYTYKSNIIGDQKLLTHELYHFHITEYIARKIRKSLKDARQEEVDVKKILKQFKEEENVLQQQYDYETHHGYYNGEQLKWQIKIDSLLNTLYNYQ